MRSAIATLKMTAFAVLTLVIIPLQSISLAISKGKSAYIFPWIWHNCVCMIFRIKVIQKGLPDTKSQTVYMSNHLSYLDIPVMASALRASFVAKKDVAGWPVFGFLSKLQQTAFISRDRADAKQGKDTLDSMLSDRKSLIIFPEGTSTDGREVRPFKSSLFSIVFKEDLKNIMVQPVTIKMENVDKKEVSTQEIRDLYAWHIDMDTPLEQHLWLFAKGTGATISLTFHQPIKAHEQENRKTLAKLCHERVSNGLAE
ncbi:MAG: lysophospholipid acyltransferase family protein [Alphaproteobacteria bacterium]